ncbi:hypothetical protein EV663_10719 [Rhodovulum bhavnagarense]|uniref:Uncharacterized protein n=1 Tax=Rhodovulum bhavnagarense TaxID=992286 RepID=A0A4R2RNS4_9RHOB|nr:hypothetical protein EV663_10719 [Rhodovulum bhavnagarense]
MITPEAKALSNGRARRVTPGRGDHGCMIRIGKRGPCPHLLRMGQGPRNGLVPLHCPSFRDSRPAPWPGRLFSGGDVS